jgi:hypothetical protein
VQARLLVEEAGGQGSGAGGPLVTAQEIEQGKRPGRRQLGAGHGIGCAQFRRGCHPGLPELAQLLRKGRGQPRPGNRREAAGGMEIGGGGEKHEQAQIVGLAMAAPGWAGRFGGQQALVEGQEVARGKPATVLPAEGRLCGQRALVEVDEQLGEIVAEATGVAPAFLGRRRRDGRRGGRQQGGQGLAQVCRQAQACATA